MEIEDLHPTERLAQALPLSKELRSRLLFHQPLRIAMHYIITHSNATIRLKTVAAAVGMERTSFCKYFRRKTGMGFCVFLQLVKITSAKQLLIESDRSIELIAIDLGYGSVSAFVRNFKRATGFTPTAFRHLSLAGEEPIARTIRAKERYRSLAGI